MSTGIEWTDDTWNPVVGCSKVSPGCDNCYAIGQAHRIQAMGGKGGEAYAGTTAEDGSDWSGVVKCLPERLEIPLRWSKPRRIFVNSMSDLFHPDVPEEFIWDVFGTMHDADQHQFQILTKRPQRMARVLGQFDGYRAEPPYGSWPLPNVWTGTSIESDKYAFRADHLRATPAAVRFLSLEPLLGPLPSLDLSGIDWVIAGGESGPQARPMHPDWVRDLRDRCQAAGVAFFFKQWGEWAPTPTLSGTRQLGHVNLDGSWSSAGIRGAPLTGEAEMIDRMGKHKAGRILDGRTWDEYPGEVL